MEPKLEIRTHGGFLLATISNGKNTVEGQRRRLHTILGAAREGHISKIIIMLTGVETAEVMSLNALHQLAEIIRKASPGTRIAVLDDAEERQVRSAFLVGSSNHDGEILAWVKTIEEAIAWLNQTTAK